MNDDIMSLLFEARFASELANNESEDSKKLEKLLVTVVMSGITRRRALKELV
jgi:hypothetical protein